MAHEKSLLIVAHTPSVNTKVMADHIINGANEAEADSVAIHCLNPLEASADDALHADAIVLLTTENLGYMSGATKDFFDRVYYPCLDTKRGLPLAAIIRAGHDGTGTKRALESITTGLGWRWTQPIHICKGTWQTHFLDDCHEIGMGMAAALDIGAI